jgi:hypothetical protein
MKSSLFVFTFVTACGPAFHSDLFGGEKDGGMGIAKTVGSQDGQTAPDATSSQREASAGDSALSSDAPQGLDIDANADAGLDAPVEACSCAELCSGAYPLRACESCYRETCPTWEGGLPQ